MNYSIFLYDSTFISNFKGRRLVNPHRPVVLEPSVCNCPFFLLLQSIVNHVPAYSSSHRKHPEVNHRFLRYFKHKLISMVLL